MRTPFSRWPRIAAVVCLLIWAASGDALAAGWKIKRLAGRDYLSIAQIAAFYEMDATAG